MVVERLRGQIRKTFIRKPAPPVEESLEKTSSVNTSVEDLQSTQVVMGSPIISALSLEMIRRYLLKGGTLEIPGIERKITKDDLREDLKDTSFSNSDHDSDS